MASNTNPSNTSEQTPGLVASHAQYIKGAAVVCPSHAFPISFFPQSPRTPSSLCTQLILKQGAVGAVTGAEDWKRSGAEQQSSAVDAMKAASENRDPAKDGYGKVEEVAGKLTGCEGMKEEGAASAQK